MATTCNHSRSCRFYPAPPLTQSQQPPSPQLPQSRSGSGNNSVSSLNSSQRFNNRSTSNSKSRVKNYVEDAMNKSDATSVHYGNAGDGSARFLGRGRERSSCATKRAKSSSSVSPSAWALSPGRSSSPRLCPLESPTSAAPNGKSGGVGGGVSGVLKYFKQKKVLTVQEEQYHQFRVLYNRLFQWRFANARADAAMAAFNVAARVKVLCVWMRLLKMRNSITEKRIQLQKLKHKIKLHQILNPSLHLLNEWATLEGRNCEAVGKLTRKLSGLSMKLPLVQGAQVDIASMYQAMITALKVMDDTETIIAGFFPQVEKILFLLTEFMSVLEHQQECLEETEKTMAMVAALMVREMSLRVYLIEANRESRGDLNDVK